MPFYFVIGSSDKDCFIHCLSKSVLLKRLNEDYYDDSNFISFDKDKKPFDAMDINYFGQGILIIKGDVANPIAKQSVVAYDID